LQEGLNTGLVIQNGWAYPYEVPKRNLTRQEDSKNLRKDAGGRFVTPLTENEQGEVLSPSKKMRGVLTTRSMTVFR